MGDFLNKIKQFVIQYKYTLISLVLLCVMALKASSAIIYDIPLFTTFYIINALSFILLIHVLSKIKYSLIPTILLGILIAFNAYFAFLYGSIMGVGGLTSILETHKEEAISMIGNELFYGLIIFGIAIFLTLKCRTELAKSKISLKISLSLLIIYTFLVLPVAIGARIKINIEGNLFRLNPTYIGQLRVNQHAPFLYGNIASIIGYIEEQRKIRGYAKNTERYLPKGVSFNESKQRPLKIFFVIGESSTRDHYSLYGYSKKTTPFLDSMYQNTSSLNKYNGIAPAAMTPVVLEFSLSFSTRGYENIFYEQKNMMELATMAGYESFWISSLSKTGYFKNGIAYIAGCATHTYFHHTEDLKIGDDLELVEKVWRLYDKDKTQLFVLHLTGSHLDYKDRIDDRDRLALPGKDDVLQNYDRSIHHTDRVLREVYKLVEKDSLSIMYYMADHGEIIGRGHGLWANGARQYRVPLLTIHKGYPMDSIMQKYIDPETNLLNISNTIYMLGEAMGYDISQENVEHAVEDGKYILQLSDGKIRPYTELKEELN